MYSDQIQRSESPLTFDMPEVRVTIFGLVLVLVVLLSGF